MIYYIKGTNISFEVLYSHQVSAIFPFKQGRKLKIIPCENILTNFVNPKIDPKGEVKGEGTYFIWRDSDTLWSIK